MRCEEAIEYLHLEVDGESLGEQTRRQLHEHVSGCAACQQARQELRALSKVLLEAWPQSVPGDFTSRVRARVAMPPARWKQQLVRLTVLPEIQLAALACLVVIAAYATPGVIRVMPRYSMTEWWNSLSAWVTLPPGLQAACTACASIIGSWSDALTMKLAEVSDTLSVYASTFKPMSRWMTESPAWWAWAGFAVAVALNMILATCRLTRLRQLAD